jgi:sec-independent protein translocase protein TatA
MPGLTPLDARRRTPRLGFGEIVMILVVALLVFGPTKLPQLGDALGKGIRNFKKAAEGDDGLPVATVAPKSEFASQAQAIPASASQETVATDGRKT